MIWSTDRSKIVFKKSAPPSPQIHDKAVQSNKMWLNLNKINRYFTISG